MRIVVDSGSTKSDWEAVQTNGDRISFQTMGFNPFFHDSERIAAEVGKEVFRYLNPEDVLDLYFYGAGCSDEFRCSIVKNALSRVFPKANIDIEHDLLAAARATLFDQPGVACIIGTGSNSCLFDGKKIVDNVTNLGFLLGDEGSGSYLGKMLIRGYFYREFPDDIRANFEREYGSEGREIINRIYGDSPNVYLASFAKFMSDFKEHLYIKKLVMEAFSEFIHRHVQKYRSHNDLPVSFVGSIAYHFQDILKLTLDEHNLTMGEIIKKPINNLVDYHSKFNLHS